MSDTRVASMNTPAHAVFNIIVLGRGTWRTQVAPIAAGSVFCDLPMFFFYFWERHIMERSQRYIWNTAYFESSWQDFFDLFNFALFSLGEKNEFV